MESNKGSWLSRNGMSLIQITITILIGGVLASDFHYSDQQLQRELVERDETIQLEIANLQEELARARDFSHLTLEPCSTSACVQITNSGPATANNLKILFFRERVTIGLLNPLATDISVWDFTVNPPIIESEEMPTSIRQTSGNDATEITIERLLPQQTINISLLPNEERTNFAKRDSYHSLFAPFVNDADVEKALEEAFLRTSWAANFEVSAICDNCGGEISPFIVPIYTLFVSQWVGEPMAFTSQDTIEYRIDAVLTFIGPTNISLTSDLHFTLDENQEGSVRYSLESPFETS